MFNTVSNFERKRVEAMIRIMIVEQIDDRARRIAAALREMAYEAVISPDSSSALDLLGRTEVQLIVANSDCGGMELTQELRDAGDITPVIVLTENETGQQKRRIFRSGADGYMLLPLDLEELQMRVRSLLWRCRIVDDAVIRCGNCRLCAQTLTLETPKGEIELRRMEFLLLEKLLSYPGRVFTRAQLMDELWGVESQSDPRTVDTHIRRLRTKLRDVEDIRLQTVRGLGYRAAIPRRIRKAERAKEKAEIQ